MARELKTLSTQIDETSPNTLTHLSCPSMSKAISCQKHPKQHSWQHKHIYILHSQTQVTRVNSTNVLDEGLRIGGRGRRMNSKVKISQTRRVSRISVVLNLAQSQSVPSRPLLAPIYRWPGLKDPVGFNTNSILYDTDSYFNYDYAWA
jgi:hypothetical protein